MSSPHAGRFLTLSMLVGMVVVPSLFGDLARLRPGFGEGGDVGFRSVLVGEDVWYLNRPDFVLEGDWTDANDEFVVVLGADGVPSLHYPEEGRLAIPVSLVAEEESNLMLSTSGITRKTREMTFRWVRPVRIPAPMELVSGGYEGLSGVCEDLGDGRFSTRVPRLRIRGFGGIQDGLSCAWMDGFGSRLPVLRDGDDIYTDVILHARENAFQWTVRAGREIMHRGKYIIELQDPLEFAPTVDPENPEGFWEDDCWVSGSEMLAYAGEIPGLAEGPVMVYVDEQPHPVEVINHGFAGSVKLEPFTPHQIRVVWNLEGVRHMAHFKAIWDPARLALVEESEAPGEGDSEEEATDPQEDQAQADKPVTKPAVKAEP